MKYFVNENCIGCGLCTSICPEVFAMSEEGTAVASGDEVEHNNLEKAKEAAHSCPVDAIESV